MGLGDRWLTLHTTFLLSISVSDAPKRPFARVQPYIYALLGVTILVAYLVGATVHADLVNNVLLYFLYCFQGGAHTLVLKTVGAIKH